MYCSISKLSKNNWSTYNITMSTFNEKFMNIYKNDFKTL